jgi:hypothetical protein
MRVGGTRMSLCSCGPRLLKRSRGAKTTYVEDERTISITDIYGLGNESAPVVAELAMLRVTMKAPFPGSVFDDA